MPTIIFFSSDAKTLYKNDVYRTLALPTGYCIRFRYLTKYLWGGHSFGEADESEERRHATKVKLLKKKFAGFRGKDALIFFVSGNKEPSSDGDFGYFAIRRVVVEDYFYEEDLDEFNFILRVEEFCEASLPAGERQSLPPQTWVSEVDVSDCRVQSWIDRVKAVEHEFQDTLFLYIKRVLKEGHSVEVIADFSKEKHHSQYCIEDESSYVLESVFYDPTGGAEITSETRSDLVSLRHPRRVGAVQDHKRLILNTGQLSQQSSDVETTLFGNDSYYVELNWSVSKSWGRTIWFGLLTMAAAIGTCLLFLARANLRDTVFSLPNLVAVGAGTIMIGLAAGALYHLFHKK